MNEKCEFEAEPDGIDLANLQIRTDGRACPHGPVPVLVYYKNPETQTEYFGRLVFDVITRDDPRSRQLCEKIGVTMTLSKEEGSRSLVARSNQWAEKYRVDCADYGRFQPGIDEIECPECRVAELPKRAAEVAQRLLEYPELYLELEREEIARRSSKWVRKGLR